MCAVARTGDCHVKSTGRIHPEGAETRHLYTCIHVFAEYIYDRRKSSVAFRFFGNNRQRTLHGGVYEHKAHIAYPRNINSDVHHNADKAHGRHKKTA